MSVVFTSCCKRLLGDKSDEELNNISAYINAIFIFGGASWWLYLRCLSATRHVENSSYFFPLPVTAYLQFLRVICPTGGPLLSVVFYSGFGLGAVLVTTTTLMVEEWPKKTTAIFLGFLSISSTCRIFSAGDYRLFRSSWRRFFNWCYTCLHCDTFYSITEESKQWKYDRESVIHKRKKRKHLATNHRTDLCNRFHHIWYHAYWFVAIFSWLPTWIKA
jgi:hypothetical protein